MTNLAQNTDNTNHHDPLVERSHGLNFEEPLLIERSRKGRSGIDLPKLKGTKPRTGQPQRDSIGLPEVSEPQAIRHFVRLSQQNFSIDSGFYPLGSCTMKHNPRLNEKVARLHLDKLGARLTELSDDQAAYIGVTPKGPFKPEHYRY